MMPMNDEEETHCKSFNDLLTRSIEIEPESRVRRV
jgi:hypothetical protein